MKLGAAFIKNIHATYGEAGKTWLNNLDEHLARLAKQWNFQLIEPVQDISYNFVAIVKLPSGLAILKTAPSPANLIAEAEWLTAHSKSVPTVLQMNKQYNAYLMEKLTPGTSLKYLVKDGQDDQATRILAQVILDLQSSNALHKTNYPHISEHISALAFLRDHVDAKMLDHAETLFRELCADRSNDIVLHGDLHHDNVLQQGNDWSVIDPHGYVGDPCAEVAPMMFNPLDGFPQNLPLQNIIENRLKILAGILPFDLARMKAWCFCLAMRSAAWDVEGFSKPNMHTVDVAKILYRIL